MMKIVRVALNVPLARDFDYLLPQGVEVVRGSRVLVPFGSQQKIGIVLETASESALPLAKLKPIAAVLDESSLFTDELWQMLTWAAHYYHTPLGEVLQQALPTKLRQGEPAEMAQPNYFSITQAGREALQQKSLQKAKKQQALLEELALLADRFEKPTACSPSAWKALLEKNYIAQAEAQANHQSWQQKLAEMPICNAQNRLVLNKSQALATSRLAYAQGFGVFLLNGVTGSGKTEVYLQVIEEVLKRGEQVLVLVPEIGLTPQAIQRFEARFNVAMDVLHSNLNETARLNVWLKAKQNETAIVIGTRSALFTPFAKLGLIIIDEEHDSSFKQQEGWRYHARDLAIWRAKNIQIPIILGSATPSLESLANVQKGKFTELLLNNRAGNAQFAHQQLIDLKHQRMTAGVSEQLFKLMQQHLEKGNQVMLFLNRRGFAPVLLCHECGWISQCEDCEKPYTYHQKQRILRCHHCGNQKPIPRQCGYCGSTHLITTGVGTEQLEQTLSERFPTYQISRIDRDSTARKGQLEQHLQQIEQGKSQILIGTQMLAKGHHFPNVTLVALINVDSGLFALDFRAEERLAQLYVQVAGRAGRAEKQGSVVLQTHYPDHPLLKTLLSEGYNAFAQEALKMRAMMQLPPFSAQILFRATAKDDAQVANFLQNLTACLTKIIEQKGWQGFQILPPFHAPMQKKAGHYRWLLLIQHTNRLALQALLDEFDKLKAENPIPAVIKLSVDVDPQDLS